jgi:MFS transporter, DHA2 family, multidrug resistance protein
MSTAAGEGGTVDAGAAAARADAPSTISSPSALLLLAWIEAIKATGGTLATVSLVDAARDMALSPTMRSAAASAVSLAIAATAVAAGVAADRLGRRPLLMASFVLAGGANLAILLFPAGWVYVAGLVVAGLGYGVMLTSSYAYTKAVAPGKSLGLGLGLVGLITTIVVMVTSIGGGALADVGWRWLFLVVPVMCAVSFVLTPRLLPPMPRVGSGRVDLAGLALLGAGMVTVISGVSRVTAHPPDRMGWLFILAGVVLFALWVIVEARRKAPAFPVRIFRSRKFVAALVVGLACPIVTAAMALTINGGVQYVKQSSAFITTIALEPFYIAGGVGGLIAGRLLASPGSERRVMTLAPLVAALGFLSLAPLQEGQPGWVFLPGILVVGAGIGAALTAQGQVIILAVAKDDYGAVTSSRTSISQLGSALGMVLTMLMVKVITGLDLWRDLKAAGVTEQQVRSTIDSVENGAPPDAFPAGLRQFLQSLETGLHGAMLAGACVLAATTVIVWALMKERRAKGG